ncbi:MAG: hypothetical protein ACYC6R_18330 [Anaerolineales bacterium]
MLKAIQTPGKFWYYTLMAISIKILHVFTSDYFAGLELVRPLLIWLALLPETKAIREKAWKAFKIWLPYLILTGTFTLWRLFIYKTPIATHNNASLFNLLLDNPWTTIKYAIIHGIPDLIAILFSSWAGIFSPKYFELSGPVNIATFGLMLVGFIFAFFFISNLNEKVAGVDSYWTRQALILGSFSIILSMLPSYAASYFITTENPPWNSRFGMAATFGAALVIAALLHILVASARQRATIVAVLFGLSLAWHINIANTFRLSWEKQIRFYEQLTWRAPTIAPNTAILTEQEILPIMGDYPTAFAVN